MSYEVLARKWRPRQFADLVGQTHVVRALTHALEQERVHHACLFTGTRGVGKTTVARILARCLNCEPGLTASPCGECPSCQEILSGRFVDLLEIDAASRTGVDDMRELLDNVQYAPVAGRYKVYLIDEVHMLSANSFNALLKTLEEPPPHVVFILATTDPKKVPVTVLSRCLQFHLRNLLPGEIVSQLETVLGGEDIGFEAGALGQLARAADGSMRDALSLTDQAISYCNGALTEVGVSEMLGAVQRGDVQALLLALAANDGARVIDLCDQLATKGADFVIALDELARALHRIMLVQAVGAAAMGDGVVAEVLEPTVRNQLAEELAPEEVQLFYQIVTDGRGQLNNAPEPRVGFEVAMLRALAFRPVDPRRLPPGNSPPPTLADGDPGVAANPAPATGVTAASPAVPAEALESTGLAGSAAAVSGGVSDSTGLAGSAQSVSAGVPESTGLAGSAAAGSGGVSDAAGLAGSAASASAGVSDSAGLAGSAAAGSGGVPESAGLAGSAASVSAGVSDSAGLAGSAASVSAGVLDSAGLAGSAASVSAGVSDSAGSAGSAASVSAGVLDSAGLAGSAASASAGVSDSTGFAGSVAATPAGVAESAGSLDSASTVPTGVQDATGLAGSAAHGGTDDWYELAAGAALRGVVRTVLDRCVPGKCAADHWELLLEPQFESLLQSEHEEVIGAALGAVLGRPLRVSIHAGVAEQETPMQHRERLEAEQRESARAAMTSDPEVQRLMKMFDATLVEDSLRPGERL